MLRKIIYLGPSMRPVFQRGDTLVVAPVSPEELRAGDVVVFATAARGQVVHRVVEVRKEGVLTKGDNNPTPDEGLTPFGDILGRVRAIQRQGRLLPVPSQPPPTLYLLRVRQGLSRLWSRFLEPLYDRLAQTGAVQATFGRCFTPRLICFTHPDGLEGQLYLGRLLIGRKLPQQPQWSLRRPFRLLVDEASLPTGFSSFPKS